MGLVLRILSIGLIVGCSSLSCEITEGAKVTKISYSRLFTTSDNIKGELPEGYKLESTNQKIDTDTIEAILKFIGTI